MRSLLWAASTSEPHREPYKALIAAGRFGDQRRVVASSGTLPIDTPTLVVLLLGTILLGGSISLLKVVAGLPAETTGGKE